MPEIEPRGKSNNTWRLVVSLGAGPGKKRIRERKTITVEDPVLLKSPTKLEKYLNQEWYNFKAEVETGAYISPEKMKFADFVDEWREKYASDTDNLSPSTLSIYEVVIRVRLIPMFGHLRIDQITAMQIVTFIKELEKPGSRSAPNTKKQLTEKQKEKMMEPLDSETIGFIYRVLKNIFSRAVDWRVIPSNPMSGVSKPAAKNARKKMLAQRANPQYYNEEEAQLVVDALYKESIKWRLLILGSMFGGCRRGELIGLEWPQVKFNDSAFSVENNIPLSEGGKALEKGPKSLASYRDVDMPEWYMEELQTYQEEWQRDKERQGDKWLGQDRAFVFHNGKGGPYYYKHPSRWWERFCKRHGIRYIKFHGLRHSSGTLLLEDEDESNFDSILMVIQRQLGHAKLSTTTDTYVHVTKRVKQRTAGKFDKFARKTPNELGVDQDGVGGNRGAETKLRRIK